VGKYNTIWLFGHKPDEIDFVAESIKNYFAIHPLNKDFVLFRDPYCVVNQNNKVETPSHYLIVAHPSPLSEFRKEVKHSNTDILWVYFDSMGHKLSDFECPDHAELTDSLILPSVIDPHRKKSIILFNFLPYSEINKKP
jgi:hypothetical protein